MSPLHVEWEPDEVPELQELLRRALNTWAPNDRPSWALELADSVDHYVMQLHIERGDLQSLPAVPVQPVAPLARK